MPTASAAPSAAARPAPASRCRSSSRSCRRSGRTMRPRPRSPRRRRKPSANSSIWRSTSPRATSLTGGQLHRAFPPRFRYPGSPGIAGGSRHGLRAARGGASRAATTAVSAVPVRARSFSSRRCSRRRSTATPISAVMPTILTGRSPIRRHRDRRSRRRCRGAGCSAVRSSSSINNNNNNNTRYYQNPYYQRDW